MAASLRHTEPRPPSTPSERQAAAVAKHRPVEERERSLHSRPEWDAATRHDDTLAAVMACTTRVYYLPHCFPTGSDLTKYVTDLPAIAVNGDRHITLQNGAALSSTGHPIPGLLSFHERRRARKKMIITLDRAYGMGGYPHGHPVTPFPSPQWMACVTLAGPQFEVGYLEARDFVVPAPGDVDHFFPAAEVDAVAEPLFPHYFPATPVAGVPGAGMGRLPTREEALAAVAAGVASHPDLDLVLIPGTGRFSDEDDAAYLHGAAYTRSLVEDFTMVLRGLDDWLRNLASVAGGGAAGAGGGDGTRVGTVPPAGAAPATLASLPTRAWVQLPQVGLGFFASYLMRTSMAPILRPRFLAALATALRGGTWTHIAVLEFSDFTSDGSFRLAEKEINSVRLVHGKRRSLLDFSHVDRTQYLPVVVNAGDSFAFPGNEYHYGSVESMLGENMSIRRTQVYLSNPALLDEACYVAVVP